MTYEYNYFDYQQYKYCILIYFDESYVYASSFATANRNLSSKFIWWREHACFTYDKEKGNLLNWGDKAFDNNNGTSDEIYVDNMISSLHSILHQEYEILPWYISEHEFFSELSSSSQIFLSCFATFLGKVVGKCVQKLSQKSKIKNLSSRDLHFAMVVPTNWTDKMKDLVLRRLFDTANITNADDSRNRLVFYTRLDSILHIAQHPSENDEYRNLCGLNTQNQYNLCVINQSRKGVSLEWTTFDLHEQIFSPAYMTGTSLMPRVIFSNSTMIDLQAHNMIDDLKAFLKRKNFFLTEEEKNHGPEIDMGKLLEILVECPSIEQKKPYKTKLFLDKGKLGQCGLSDRQVDTILSMTIDEIYDDSCFSIAGSVIKYIVDSSFKNSKTSRVALMLDQNQNERPYGTAFLDQQGIHTNGSQEGNYFLKWLLRFFEYYVRYNVIASKSGSSFSEIPSEDILKGAGFKMEERIKASDMVSPLMFKNEKSSKHVEKVQVDTTIVRLALSAGNVRFAYSTLGGRNTVLEGSKSGDTYSFLNSLRPLTTYFRNNTSSSVMLIIPERLMAFIENHFQDCLVYFSSYDRQSNREHIDADEKKDSKKKRKVKSRKIRERYFKAATARMPIDFFSGRKLKCKTEIEIFFQQASSSSEDSPEIFVRTPQQKYIKVFITMYLWYMNELVTDQLKLYLGAGRLDNKTIGYIFSVDKVLLDTVIGTKGSFKELLYASGIIQKAESSAKVQIVTHGEVLLSALQEKIIVRPPREFHFVLSQLHEDYIHLTLSKLVNKSYFDRNDDEYNNEADTVIIQEKVIRIDNVYNSLSENMWKNAGYLIECCKLHEVGEEGLDAIYTKKNFRSFTFKLKEHLSQIASSSVTTHDSQIDMKERISISNECKCAMHMSVRHIVENGFKPVIDAIIRVIVSTINNTDLFASFTIERLFISGNFIDSISNVAIQKSLNSKIEEAWQSEIISKRNFEVSRCNVLESLDSRLFRLSTGMKHIYHERLNSGTLHQVAGKTYGLYFVAFDEEDFKIKGMEISYGRDGGNSVNVKDGHAIIILQMGDIVTHEGVTKTIYGKLKDNEIQGYIEIHLIQLVHVEKSRYSDVIPLDGASYNIVRTLTIGLLADEQHGNAVLPIIVKMKPKTQFSSLQFMLQYVGGDDYQDMWNDAVEQLTLAYL